ncbi:MAG: hypothetical protein ACXWWC_04740 [Chitinophagaceae bacterium]
MKAINYLAVLSFAVCSAFIPSTAQDVSMDSTGLPGDNFSLHGALEMFQNAGSPEEFEKLINNKDNSVNNLDMNGDGETDYIRVIDKTEKDLHAFVLQVPVSESESQDIAVIEIEKTGDTTAMLQIIGDEDIYGEVKIVEPDGGEDDAAFIEFNYNRIQSGSYSFYNYNAAPRIVINVWRWPSVRFVYAPGYRPWVSPWSWRNHPAWWRPWKPLAWHSWHPRHVHFHRHFAVVRTHRVVRAHAIYRPARVHSVAVRNRHATAVGNYRVTRSRTTVTGPRGNNVTRKTTRVQGPRGKVKASKTTVKRKRR